MRVYNHARRNKNKLNLRLWEPLEKTVKSTVKFLLIIVSLTLRAELNIYSHDVTSDTKILDPSAYIVVEFKFNFYFRGDFAHSFLFGFIIISGVNLLCGKQGHRAEFLLFLMMHLFCDRKTTIALYSKWNGISVRKTIRIGHVQSRSWI